MFVNYYFWFEKEINALLMALVLYKVTVQLLIPEVLVVAVSA